MIIYLPRILTYICQFSKTNTSDLDIRLSRTYGETLNLPANQKVSACQCQLSVCPRFPRSHLRCSQIYFKGDRFINSEKGRKGTKEFSTAATGSYR